MPRPQAFTDIRFVVFDAVGTLIRVQPSVAEVYYAVGNRFGSQLTVDQIQLRFQQSIARFQDCGPTSELHEQQRWRAIVAEVLHDIRAAGDGPFEELWAAFARPEQWSLYHDVPEVWEELGRRGLRIGIASNFDSRLRPICCALPPLGTAAHLFVSSQIGFPKPHPEFYRRVEQELNAQPAEIILVGDSTAHDVEGAISAGWQAIHLDRNGLQDGERSISTLTELLRLF